MKNECFYNVKSKNSFTHLVSAYLLYVLVYDNQKV